LNDFNIKHRPIEYVYWKRDADHPVAGAGAWFRIFGWGLWFSNGNLSFSERNGYKKVRKLPFGWRWGILKRGKCGHS
jgi:hypothetical protein